MWTQPLPRTEVQKIVEQHQQPAKSEDHRLATDRALDPRRPVAALARTAEKQRLVLVTTAVARHPAVNAITSEASSHRSRLQQKRKSGKEREDQGGVARGRRFLGMLMGFLFPSCVSSCLCVCPGPPFYFPPCLSVSREECKGAKPI